MTERLPPIFFVVFWIREVSMFVNIAYLAHNRSLLRDLPLTYTFI
nr:MAG TPA: hypothetical protein [Caudoviricetes sp.]